MINAGAYKHPWNIYSGVFYLNDAEKRNTRLIDYKIKGPLFLSAWEYYELVRYRTESDF